MTVKQLRHDVPGVATAIVRVQRAAYSVEAQIIGYDRMPPLRETTADVASLDVTFLGAFDPELVGILGYRRDMGCVDIDRLAVDPDRFRRGIGGALIRELHRREGDAERFDVSTGADNGPALALYAAFEYQAYEARLLDSVRVAFLRRDAATGRA